MTWSWRPFTGRLDAYKAPTSGSTSGCTWPGFSPHQAPSARPNVDLLHRSSGCIGTVWTALVQLNDAADAFGDILPRCVVPIDAHPRGPAIRGDQLRRAQSASSSHTSRSAQRRSATRTPQLAPLRHDLMRHAQLTSDLRRNLASPKQLSRSHAALFHRLHIAPRPTTSAYRNRSRRFPVKSWAHAPSLSHKPMAPVVPRPQSVSRVSFRNRRAPFEVPRRMRRQ
jgi:hypothetical protein